MKSLMLALLCGLFVESNVTLKLPIDQRIAAIRNPWGNTPDVCAALVDA
jgi:hypothetical protein